MEDEIKTGDTVKNRHDYYSPRGVVIEEDGFLAVVEFTGRGHKLVVPISSLIKIES